MSKLVTLSFTMFLVMCSAANARIVTCTFDNWKGAKTEDVSISWTGLKVELDHSRSKVRRVWSGGVEKKWYSTEVRKTENFSTYVYFKEAKDVKDKKHRIRFSIRFFTNGKCEAHVTEPRSSFIRPMVASGRWDR